MRLQYYAAAFQLNNFSLCIESNISRCHCHRLCTDLVAFNSMVLWKKYIQRHTAYRNVEFIRKKTVHSREVMTIFRNIKLV